MKTATVTTQPDGQVVHLPAEIRLQNGEVFVTQVGRVSEGEDGPENRPTGEAP